MRSFLRTVLYLWSVFVGLCFAAGYFHPPLAAMAGNFLAGDDGRLVSGVIAGFLLSSPLLVLLRWIQSIRRNREISYQTDSGRISVSLIAIEEALTRVVEGEPEVKKAHVRVFEDRMRRGVVVEAVVTMWEVPNVTDRNRFLQRLLRRRFAELMPEQDAVDVNLHLHRLTERRPDQTPPVRAATSSDPGTSSASRASVTAPVKDDEPPAHEANPDTSPEDSLYLGPTYPVTDDDDESASSFVTPVPKTKGRR